MHRCECKHVELRYCKECDKVYCSCGKEWGEKVYMHYGTTYDGVIAEKLCDCISPGVTAITFTDVWPGCTSTHTTDLPESY